MLHKHISNNKKNSNKHTKSQITNTIMSGIKVKLNSITTGHEDFATNNEFMLLTMYVY